jgi:hypothetical protein
MAFILRGNEFDTSSSGFKPGTSPEDLTEMGYFKTLLPDHTVDVFTTEHNK